ncbi:MAG: PKD domain-containing protein, partial [Anaerolineae bacterium]|nr:PKD domain-containing protein [Anaerolineae bacterium]
DAAGLADGVYTTTLEVTSDDPDEPQVDVAVVLTVTSECIPVQGTAIGYTPAEPSVGEPIAFVGSVEQGTLPITYTWAFGDGGAGVGRTIVHTYTAVGTYTVVLTTANACGEDTVMENLVVADVVHSMIYMPLMMRDYP